MTRHQFTREESSEGAFGQRLRMTKSQRIERAKKANAARKNRRGRAKGDPGRCSYCKKPGHYRTHCPMLMQVPKPI